MTITLDARRLVLSIRFSAETQPSSGRPSSRTIAFNLQEVARYFRNGFPGPEKPYVLETYLRYALSLVLAFGPARRHSEPVGEACAAAARALLVLPLDKVMTDTDLKPFVTGLEWAFVGLSQQQKWRLITSTTMSQPIVRACVAARPAGQVLHWDMHWDIPFYPETQVVLGTLTEAASFTLGESWPGLASPELCYASIDLMVRCIHPAKDIGDMREYLPLLQWLGESVVRDPTVAREAHRADFQRLFVRAAQMYMPKPYEQELEEGPSYRNRMNDWVVLLFLGLAYLAHR